MLNEDLKKSRENGQHGDSKTSSNESDLSLLLVLGISAIGGLIAFCIIALVLSLCVKKTRNRRNRRVENPIEQDAPILRRDRSTRRDSKAGRLSLLANQVRSYEARLGQLELSVQENFDQLSPGLGRREQLFIQRSSETTRVRKDDTLSSFKSRRQTQRDDMERVAQSKSKKGDNTFASVTPSNLRRTKGCEDLNVETIEMMPLIAPRRASEYLEASVSDYQQDGFPVSLETLGETVNVGSDGYGV